MILKIVNNQNNENSWVVNSIFNSYQVVKGKDSRLYNFWFEFNSPVTAKDVFDHISHLDKIFGDRPIQITVIDDSGNESENLISVTNGDIFKAGINQDDNNVLYMELRNNFKEMEVYTTKK